MLTMDDDNATIDDGIASFETRLKWKSGMFRESIGLK